MILSNYIYCKNYLSNKECDEVLNELNNKDWQKHLWYSATKNLSHNENKDCDVLYYHNELIINKVKKSLLDYCQYIKTKHKIYSHFTQPRFNKYKKNKTMRDHIDHIQSIFDGKNKGIPVLTILGLLNNSFEGGELLINNKKINFSCGDIVIFPSVFLYPHKVNEIKKGERYSYVSWAF